MQASDVHMRVEARPRRAGVVATVKATLAGNLTGPVPRFLRVARGRYTVPPALNGP